MRDPTQNRPTWPSPDAAVTRRFGRQAMAALGGASSLIAAGCGWDGPVDPTGLATPQALPTDVVAEVDAVWAGFADAFAGQRNCIEGAELWLVADVVGGDARYIVDSARVEIEIPTTPERFRESLVHELAHHVEHNCATFDELRAEVHPLLGEDRPWAGGTPWEDVPSERWAETVVALVGVERVRHADSMPIDERWLAHVRRWAAD